MRKSPALLQEMINVGCQLTMMANSRGGESLPGDTPLSFLCFSFSALTLVHLLACVTGFHAPRLTTIENCMKLTQMIVQGLQESKSPLLQLPHFEDEHLRYCLSKKVTTESDAGGGGGGEGFG